MGDRAVLPAGRAGYSRDGKKGCEQVEYGVLTDPGGRPVTVRVFGGATADPESFKLGINKLVLVGDRGMITAARIGALHDLNSNPETQQISTGSPHYAHPRSPNSRATAGRCETAKYKMRKHFHLSITDTTFT
jgi:transposase